MDDLTRRFLRLLVARLPEHTDLIRATYHDAVDVELDAALAPERPRRKRPPPAEVLEVDEVVQQKATNALRRHGYPIK